MITAIILWYLAGVLWAYYVLSLMHDRRWYWMPVIWPLMLPLLCWTGVRERDYI